MIGSFRQYLVEEEKTVFFSFGRMNPPTIGHEKLLDKLASTAGKNPYRMYLSQSTDAKKNPLSYKDKVKFVRKMFPRHARNVLMNNKINTVFDAAVSLYNEGFRKVVMVVGSDRVREFDTLLSKYNGEKGRHGFYNFADIKVVSAGARDPDAEGVEGMSASKMRAAASDNDFTTFAQGLPKAFSNADSKALFNSVRKGMGLKEATEFRNHIQLAPVSEVRESYVDGKLFEIGDQVVIKENGEIGKVKRLGSNYVIIESKSNEYRKWLDAVEKIEQQYPEYEVASFSMSLSEANNKKSMYADKPDWGTPESTKKAKKMTPGEEEVDEGNGLWANIHAKRARGERMRKKGEKGAPTPDAIKSAQKEERTPQDPDIKDRKGSQPKAYHAGLEKSTKVKRDAHFKKYGKKADNDASAYKPAPGDKSAKTKPSVWTKRFKDMYGEQVDPVDVAKQRIDREKKADAVRHDRMMDRARTKATTMKNKETKPND